MILYTVRIGSSDADIDELTLKNVIELVEQKKKVYLVVGTDCGKPEGKYRQGMTFFLKRVLQDRLSFYVYGPITSTDDASANTQLRYKCFEIQVPPLEEESTPPLEE